jgi:hypothetical protein
MAADSSTMRIDNPAQVIEREVDDRGRIVVGRKHAGRTVRVVEAEDVTVAVEIETVDESAPTE